MAERQNILTSTPSTELQDRLDGRIRAWRIVVERLVDTHTSVLALGRRDGDPVVLKIVKARGEEWRSGDIVDAFERKGVVRVYEHVEGAMLLEGLRPGRSLLGVALSGADDDHRNPRIIERDNGWIAMANAIKPTL